MACDLKRILQFKSALQYQQISIVNDKKDITESCEFSWSVDGSCWTNWCDVKTYNRIGPGLDTDFYLKIRLSGPFTKVLLGGHCTDCYNICIDSSMNFLEKFCESQTLFQPYNNLDCALQLQEQLSDSIVCMFGIPVFYFKIDPNKAATDYTFKEHFLYHVSDMKQLKLMILDGQMPSSNPKLTEFDFEWETDWETELSKTQFAAAFGDTAYPKTGDFIYIPLMKRMWEVNSAYDEKNEGLLWRSTTWKLSLTKYSESTNVAQGSYDDIIDDFVQLYDDVFGKAEKKEQERVSGSQPLSAPKFAATNLFNIFMEDAVRKQYTKHDISIIDKTYNHKGLVVSRNIYKFRNENGCVTYQKPACGDSGTAMLILETGGTLKGSLNRTIMEIGEVSLGISYDETSQKFSANFGELSQELNQFSSYLIIIRWNRATYSSELNIYRYTHREGIPVYSLRPEMYWFDFENPLCELVGPYNNDYDMREEMECSLHGYPMSITNFKYYDVYMDKEEAIKESLKYTTQHKSNIINDLARPISSGHGYTVK